MIILPSNRYFVSRILLLHVDIEVASGSKHFNRMLGFELSYVVYASLVLSIIHVFIVINAKKSSIWIPE